MVLGFVRSIYTNGCEASSLLNLHFHNAALLVDHQTQLLTCLLEDALAEDVGVQFVGWVI